MMKASELHMDAIEMRNLMKALILALPEAIDCDRLQEATLRHLGAINEDQRTGLDTLFLELNALTITEADVDDALTAMDAVDMMQELLDQDTDEEDAE